MGCDSCHPLRTFHRSTNINPCYLIWESSCSRSHHSHNPPNGILTSLHWGLRSLGSWQQQQRPMSLLARNHEPLSNCHFFMVNLWGLQCHAHCLRVHSEPQPHLTCSSSILPILTACSWCRFVAIAMRFHCISIPVYSQGSTCKYASTAVHLHNYRSHNSLQYFNHLSTPTMTSRPITMR